MGLNAGIDLSLPLIPGGGFTAAVETAVGEAGNHFKFRMAPQAIIEIPGPDGPLGAFYISGKGRNLIDDGGDYDDGAYGEIDLGQADDFYLAGSLILEWRGEGGRQRFVDGNIAIDVPREYLYLDVELDWTVPLLLPDGTNLGDIGVRGSATYNEADPAPDATGDDKLVITGEIILFDETFSSVTATIDGPELTFATTWQSPLPDGAPFTLAALQAVTTSYTVNFEEGTACGSAQVDATGGATCQVGACFNGFDDPPTLTFNCDIICGQDGCGLLGDPLPGVEYCGDPNDRTPICNRDCGLCVVGEFCDENADCESRDCLFVDIAGERVGTCVPAIRCGDSECTLFAERCGYGSADGRCQGDCGLCGLNGSCGSNRDCRSNNCGPFATCQPRCGDGVKEGLETCGSGNSGNICESDAGKCPNGGALNCNENADCQSGYCNVITQSCIANPCGRNPICDALAGERCGFGNAGPECQQECGLCDGLAICNGNSDCKSGACTNGLCDRCGDDLCPGLGRGVGVAGTESCGSNNSGTTCNDDCGLCNDGATCDGDDDCHSGYCLGVVCAPPPCGDGVCTAFPGVEKCGGSDEGEECFSECGKCAFLFDCNSDDDCLSNNCVDGSCGLAKRDCGDGVCAGGTTETCGNGEDYNFFAAGYACEDDCDKCPMRAACTVDNQCDGGHCVALRCAGCGDGLCDFPWENCGYGTSDGVCQQDCRLCPAWSFCDENRDCRSESCAGTCLPVCGDGECNGGEGCGASDLHCRRDCGLCADGTECGRSADCVNWCAVRNFDLPRCGPWTAFNL